MGGMASGGWRILQCVLQLWLDKLSVPVDVLPIMARSITDMPCEKGIGVFQDYYEANQLKNYSPSAVAWIPSVESFMLFVWVEEWPQASRNKADCWQRGLLLGKYLIAMDRNGLF